MSVNNSITGGTIAIEDGIKAKEEFAPARKVKVELSFSVPEGQDGAAYMHGVARVAEAKVASMLGRTAPAEVVNLKASDVPATPAAPAKAETAAAKKKREAVEKAAAEAAKPERTKADLEREMLEAASGGKKTPATGVKSDEELLEDEPTITAAGAVVANDDDLGDLLGDAAPAPVTDLELGKAAQEKNAKMKAANGEAWAPAKIRDLINTYSGGKRINDIPAAKRPQFLTDLAALT